MVRYELALDRSCFKVNFNTSMRMNSRHTLTTKNKFILVQSRASYGALRAHGAVVRVVRRVLRVQTMQSLHEQPSFPTWLIIIINNHLISGVQLPTL